MKWVCETAMGKRLRFMKKGEVKSPNKFQMFHGFIVINMKIMAELGPSIRTVNLFQDVRITEVWNQEIAGVRNQELAEVRNQEVMGIWSHEPAKLWNHGPAKLYVQIPEIRES
jgi:hypothetical protein